MSDGLPKSALELTMEKLKRQDAEGGEAIRTLTDSQKAAIAEARSQCEAKTAECRILHDAAVTSPMDPEARRVLEDEFQRDLARFVSRRDQKIAQISKGDSAE